MKRVVLDFSRTVRPGEGPSPTRLAADAVAKEHKGTKEVDVPLEVIPDLPTVRARSATAPALSSSPADADADTGAASLAPSTAGPSTIVPAATVPSTPGPSTPGPSTTTGPSTSVPAVTGEVPDEALARRAALGDKRAFTVLADRYGPALHRHVSRMLADPGAVEDCLQETMLAAWRGLPGFRGEAGVKTWLFAIARRQVFAHCRKNPPASSLSGLDPADVAEQVVAPGGDPAEVSLDAALLQAVEGALRLLPEQQRAAWLLKEVEGLSYLQIAAVLEVSPATVRGLLARARTTLSAVMQAWR